MAITRRRFLKHLVSFYALAVVAPAATIEPMGNLATEATAEIKGEWINLETASSMYGNAIDPTSSFEDGEERLNPLYMGEVGEYNNVTLHFHKPDGRRFKSIGR
jgi:hypothetical protein